MVCYIYTRVSHKSSSESGLSVEEQISQGMSYMHDRIENATLGQESYCGAPGVFYDKAVSGWSRPFSERPAGRVLFDLAKPGDHIICYSIDRLARNVRDFCNTTFDLNRRGVHLHYICEQIDTSTALGKMQAHCRAAAAQYMSDQISERTKEAKLIRSVLGNTSTAKFREKREWLPADLKMPVVESKSQRPIGTIYRYERVSTYRQVISGLGLESQSIRNESYANRLAKQTGAAIHPTAFVDEAESAFRTPLARRAAGSELLKLLKPGDDLVIYKLDRAWRDIVEALTTIRELTSRGINVHLVHEGIRTDTEHGSEWLGFLASMAQLESTFRSRRVREAFARCRAQGRPVGQIAAGLKAVQVGNKHKIVPDTKTITNMAMTWVMREMLEMSHKEVDSVKFAYFCNENRLRPVLKNYKEMRPDRDIQRLDKLRPYLPDRIWENCVRGAYKKLINGVDPKYLPDGCPWPSRELIIECSRGLAV
jgi:putative DNA-invertase from lambdoid prophage Rac